MYTCIQCINFVRKQLLSLSVCEHVGNSPTHIIIGNGYHYNALPRKKTLPNRQAYTEVSILVLEHEYLYIFLESGMESSMVSLILP